jgi:ceramide glucosyltransferase
MIALAIVAVIAGAYQLFAIAACVFFRNSRPHQLSLNAAVSILKPIRGVDPSFREAIRSHTVLHGDYEFLCGVRERDPASAVLREIPGVRVVAVRTNTPNGKVGALMDLSAAASHPIFVLSDSDIRVEPDYVERVTAPLADPRVGLVTCLYRPIGDTFAARFEGLGITTDFAPSTLVARLVGVDEFAMGSTIAVRRVDVERIGGFAAVKDYLADDYQIGHRIHGLGLRCVLSDVIVETHMGGDWSAVWKHQLRWARTIRVVNFAGYLGLPITNATLWALVAMCFGRWEWAAALLVVRLLMAFVAGWFVMRSRDAVRLLLLTPVRDLFTFAVWLVALFGKTVEWRGVKMRLDRDGRILNS